MRAGPAMKHTIAPTLARHSLHQNNTAGCIMGHSWPVSLLEPLVWIVLIARPLLTSLRRSSCLEWVKLSGTKHLETMGEIMTERTVTFSLSSVTAIGIICEKTKKGPKGFEMEESCGGAVEVPIHAFKKRFDQNPAPDAFFCPLCKKPFDDDQLNPLSKALATLGAIDSTTVEFVYRSTP
jgi:hypothetical protein